MSKYASWRTSGASRRMIALETAAARGLLFRTSSNGPRKSGATCVSLFSRRTAPAPRPAEEGVGEPGVVPARMAGVRGGGEPRDGGKARPAAPRGAVGGAVVDHQDGRPVEPAALEALDALER